MMTPSSPAAKIQANLKDLFKANLAPGEPYIQFQLTTEMSALLSMEQVQESLVVEAEYITPLPNMPKSVIGIMNVRDRVFCVFDLAQILSLPCRSISPQQYQIIVVEVSKAIASEQEILYLGLAIEKLQGMTRVTSEQINSNTDYFSSSLASYLQGYVTKESKPIPILSLEKIAQATARQDL